MTLRAVHPNAGVEAWYERELLAIIDGMHDDLKREVLGVYATEFDDAEFAHDAPRNPSLLMRAALKKWGGLWTRKLDKLSLDLSKKFARKNFTVTQTQLKSAFAEAGFTVKFEPTPASVTAYHAVVSQNVGLIKSIPQQYLKEVETKVWNAVMQGGDLHTLTTNLQKSYNVSAERAAIIARTENAKAKAVIESARRQELGVTHAIWMHSSGGKVPRPTHVRQDGKKYDIRTGWYDPDAEGKGKGAFVWPGTLINCRCTSKAIIPAFE